MKTLQQIIAGRVAEARQHSRNSWQDEPEWREGYRRMKAAAMQDARTLRELDREAAIPGDYRSWAVRELLTCVTKGWLCYRGLREANREIWKAKTPGERRKWAWLVVETRADLRYWQRQRQTLLAQITEELRHAHVRRPECD